MSSKVDAHLHVLSRFMRFHAPLDVTQQEVKFLVSACTSQPSPATLEGDVWKIVQKYKEGASPLHSRAHTLLEELLPTTKRVGEDDIFDRAAQLVKETLAAPEVAKLDTITDLGNQQDNLLQHAMQQIRQVLAPYLG